jgi:uncharacterized protein with von Willebrand factor type A (vWA) domain
MLRGLGLEINSERLAALARALSTIDLANERDFYFTARACLTRRAEDLPVFDRAYRMFFLGLRQSTKPKAPIAKARKQELLSLESESEADASEAHPQAVAAYSAQEQLRTKDFSELTVDEELAIERMISHLAWNLGTRRTRRPKPGPGPWLDLRRTTRAALMHGGEWLSWSWRRPKLKPRDLILLVDVSGSMDEYARLLLQFAYGLYRGLEQHVEAFVFGTRLTRISRQLRSHGPQRALREVSRLVTDWAGGTRIGDALMDFNFQWARRVRSQGAVVVMISDGLDRGDTQLLAKETARLQRSSHRLIWMNPLLRDPEFQPLARGMRAALPYVDDFMPIHNFASLQAFASTLLQQSRNPRYRPEHRTVFGATAA